MTGSKLGTNELLRVAPPAATASGDMALKDSDFVLPEPPAPPSPSASTSKVGQVVLPQSGAEAAPADLELNESLRDEWRKFHDKRRELAS